MAGKKVTRKWLVVGAATVTVYVEVEASSKTEAIAKANELPSWAWEVDSVDGVPEAHDAGVQR